MRVLGWTVGYLSVVKVLGFVDSWVHKSFVFVADAMVGFV